LEGLDRVDRRAVYRSLNWRAKHNKDTDGRTKATMKGIVCAAGTYQKQLFGAGMADSATCVFCDTGEEEDARHCFWACPAWSAVRKTHFGTEVVDVAGLPPITQHCGLLCEPEGAEDFEEETPRCGPLPEPPHWERGRYDEVYEYGQRVVWTDGSGKGTSGSRKWRRAGYGVAWGVERPCNVAEPLAGSWQSSQRAELSAVVHALHLDRASSLVVRSDSAWTLTGAVLLAAGHRPDHRWEHGDLWHALQQQISSRPPTARVTWEKVKAHTTAADVAAGLISELDQEGNGWADTLADEGGEKHPPCDRLWSQATQRARDQRPILRGLADIVHARNSKLAELQKDTEEGGVPEKQQTPEASPWRREPAEAHRYFRPPGDGFNWATAAKDFPGGERGLRSVAHFCADLQ